VAFAWMVVGQRFDLGGQPEARWGQAKPSLSRAECSVGEQPGKQRAGEVGAQHVLASSPLVVAGPI
jgi:hypothetical protein